MCPGEGANERVCFPSALGTERYVATENNGGGSGRVTLSKVEEFCGSSLENRSEFSLEEQQVPYYQEFMSGSSSAHSRSAVCCTVFLPSYPFIQKNF